MKCWSDPNPWNTVARSLAILKLLTKLFIRVWYIGLYYNQRIHVTAKEAVIGISFCSKRNLQLNALADLKSLTRILFSANTDMKDDIKNNAVSTTDFQVSLIKSMDVIQWVVSLVFAKRKSITDICQWCNTQDDIAFGNLGTRFYQQDVLYKHVRSSYVPCTLHRAKLARPPMK